MILSNEIKAQMRRVGLTQEQLSAKLGINQATLNRKINEPDGKNLSVKEALAIGNALRLTPESLTAIFFAQELADTQD
ncbi:helix-turn-helix transcriptional regulator [Butyrivibrio sp.]|uniref:helix-turn-helix transcriptional regulator n=1 Tax=Butyrivibrio sp. TaxID=28121 RepID=UPI0025C254B7|nr:helix-turn-helix transcriptional regulator [Butyrivibrio sp.]MBQ9302063.1 helix-turn-helix transcriptional regulator [Butyrivibrio sp.]